MNNLNFLESDSLQTKATDYLLPVYRRCDALMVRGDGVFLYDDASKKYLDFASGIATNALGHNHEVLNAALIEQAGKLWHCSNMFRNQPLEDFATLLCENSFAQKVFFCSSGTEAVEAAIKTIRRYHYSKGQDRPLIVAADGAFHGRTTGALAACSNAKSKVGFEPLMQGFTHITFNDVRAIEKLDASQIAAVMLETVQGEGGVRPHDREYLRFVRAWCDANDILFFLDEIQCGYGRTGHLFAFESYGITPDIVTVAKGIGGGFPLAGMLCSSRAASGMDIGSHGSTYGSNPLACAVGLATLKQILASGFLENVRNVGEYLASELDKIVASYPHIFEERRGVGLMQGLVVAENVDRITLSNNLREAGLLVAPAVSNVIRILPPLIIERDHVDMAINIIEQTLS
jgi:acetylornithine/N-succinyldiaminopimelate aminotransferase